MIVNILSNIMMKNIYLSDKKLGFYWIEDLSGVKWFSIEGDGSNWIIKWHLSGYFLFDNKHYDELVLLNDRIYYGFKDDEQIRIMICVYEQKDYRYQCYVVDEDDEVLIGRNCECHIQYQKAVISNYHARLSFHQKWKIEDLDSRNGIFWKGRRINQIMINQGIVAIVDLRIILLKHLIVIPIDDLIVINGLKPANVPVKINKKTNVKQYYRDFRVWEALTLKQITINDFQNNNINKELPIIYLIAPSLMMALGSITATVISFRSSSLEMMLPSLIMSGSMLLGSVLLPILMHRYQKKEALKDNQENRRQYQDYLEHKIADIKILVNQEFQQKENAFLTMKKLYQDIINQKGLLFAKRKEHDDYLQLSLGKGNYRAYVDVEIINEDEIKNDNPFSNQLEALKTDMLYMKDVWVIFDLKKYPLVSIFGNQSINLFYHLLLQLATYHGYDDIRICLFVSNNQLQKFVNLRFLPHLMDKKRLLICNNEDCQNLMEFIEEINSKEITKDTIIMVDDYDNFNNINILKQWMEAKKDHLYFIMRCDSYYQLPDMTMLFVEANQDYGIIYDRGLRTYPKINFKYDLVNNIDDYFYALNQVKLFNSKQTRFIDDITILTLFHVNKIKQLNIFERWVQNDTIHAIKAGIGVDEMNSIIYLDLHEKAQGPHGLIAGMTGSGKSELIISYLYALAINYDPRYVSFCIIDYKGGGLADAFSYHGKLLPHIVGIITNLDGEQIERSLLSLQGEIIKRQKLINEAKVRCDDNNIDIYRYQKYYKEKKLNEPLPHLLIVVDEFAELKNDQEAFMNQLIKASRIGRSLGIHLILSTQKPYGVVDDQIWSNASFHICLKVANANDSIDMIHSDVGANLTQPGRFYLQIGNSEQLLLAQGAYSQNPYDEEKKPNYQLHVCNNQGIAIKKELYLQKEKKKDSERVVLLKYMINLQEKLKLASNILWQKPLSKDMSWEKLLNTYEKKKALALLVGEIDDPLHQSKKGLYIDIKKSFIMIYGSRGSGKTLFIQDVLTALIQDYDSKKIHVYLVDMENQNLKIYQKCAIVGDVIEKDELEKQHRLWNLIEKVINDRRVKQEITYHLVIIIHGFNAFIDSFEDHERMIALIQIAHQYQIHFILSETAIQKLPYTLLQSVHQSYSMYYPDDSDYSLIFHEWKRKKIPAIYGRGCLYQGEFYTFQLVRNDDKLINKMIDKQNMEKVQAIQTMPIKIDGKILQEKCCNNEVALGLDDDLEIVKIDCHQSVIAVSENPLLYQMLKNYLKELGISIEIVSTNGFKKQEGDMIYLWLGVGFYDQWYFNHNYQSNKEEMRDAYLIMNNHYQHFKLIHMQ